MKISNRHSSCPEWLDRIGADPAVCSQDLDRRVIAAARRMADRLTQQAGDAPLRFRVDAVIGQFDLYTLFDPATVNIGGMEVLVTIERRLRGELLTLLAKRGQQRHLLMPHGSVRHDTRVGRLVGTTMCV